MATALLSRLHALSPFGPIFAKELRTTARRKRSYLLRVFYLGGLLLALMMGYFASSDMFGGGGRGVAAQAMAQAELGASFFVFFSFFCLAAMAVIGPVLTSTAISSEKLAKTFPVLLMTPINTWQIVGGKLFSRLLVALTLIGLSLPVLALVRLLGGVELWQMAAVVSLCATTALFTASVGLFFSTFINRAYAAILLSYLALFVLYVFIPFVIGAVTTALTINSNAMGPPSWLMWVLTVIAAINPGVSMGTVVMPPNMMFGAQWVPCVLVHLGATALMVLCSALIVRRIARRAGELSTAVAPPEYLPPQQAMQPPTMQAAMPPPLPGGPAAAPPPTLSLQYAAPTVPQHKGPERRPSDVGDNPVLWRELRRPLLSKSWQKVLAIWGTLVLVLGSYALFGINDALDEAELQTVYVSVFNAFVWVLAAVLSATAIAQEKEGDTWTLLLSTPVSGTAIVWGKVLGLCRRMLWPYLLVAAHFTIFALAGVVSWWTVGLVLWVIASFNVVWIATGVFLSLWLRKVTLAVILNLLLAVFAYLGVLVVLEILNEVPPLAREIVYAASLALAVVVIAALLARLAWQMSREPARRAARLIWAAALAALLLLAALPLGYLLVHLYSDVKWDRWDRVRYADGSDHDYYYDRSLSEHVGWYAPYYHLVQWIDWEDNHRDDHHWRWGTLELPGRRNDVPPATYLAAVFFIGCVHVFLAWLLLTAISLGFDRIVGRASQQRAGPPTPAHGRIA